MKPNLNYANLCEYLECEYNANDNCANVCKVGKNMTELVYKDLSYKIIGILF